ncbi:MAG TPA: PIN domain-containing protein [Pirellulales bacterium]|jgi:hypothetical protein
MIFVDTGAWFAANIPQDRDFAAAQAFLLANDEPLVTTDYVVAELLTLFRARGHRKRAVVVGRELLEGQAALMVRIDEGDFAEAWRVHRTFEDKDWSFVDCASYAVIKRLGIKKAFAFDEHFRQFGDIEVVP